MKLLKPKDVRNSLYYFLGAVLLVLNYIRHFFLGYRNPRPSSFALVEKSIDARRYVSTIDYSFAKEWFVKLCILMQKNTY